MPTEFVRLDDAVSDDGHRVPAYLLAPPNARAGAVLAHGYGGCKEQMLGLAAMMARPNIATRVEELLAKATRS